MFKKENYSNLIEEAFIREGILDGKSYSHKPHLQDLPHDLNTNDLSKLKERADGINDAIRDSKKNLKKYRDAQQRHIDALKQWGGKTSNAFDKLLDNKFFKSRDFTKYGENYQSKFDNAKDNINKAKSKVKDIQEDINAILKKKGVINLQDFNGDNLKEYNKYLTDALKDITALKEVSQGQDLVTMRATADSVEGLTDNGGILGRAEIYNDWNKKIDKTQREIKDFDNEKNRLKTKLEGRVDHNTQTIKDNNSKIDTLKKEIKKIQKNNPKPSAHSNYENNVIYSQQVAEHERAIKETIPKYEQKIEKLQQQNDDLRKDLQDTNKLLNEL